MEVNYDPNRGWSSKASDIKYLEEPIIANVFCFAKERMIDQLRRASKSEKGCIVRDKIIHQMGSTLELTMDNDYGDFNTYPIEVEIGENSDFVNGESYPSGTSKYKVISAIESMSWDFNADDLRITISEKSNDKAVRDLLEYLLYERSFGKYTIGFK